MYSNPTYHYVDDYDQSRQPTSIIYNSSTPATKSAVTFGENPTTSVIQFHNDGPTNSLRNDCNQNNNNIVYNYSRSSSNSRQSNVTAAEPDISEVLKNVQLPPVNMQCCRDIATPKGTTKWLKYKEQVVEKTVNQNFQQCSTCVKENEVHHQHVKTVITNVNRNHYHVHKVVVKDNNYHHYLTNNVIRVNDIHHQKIEEMRGEGTTQSDYKCTHRVEPGCCQIQQEQNSQAAPPQPCLRAPTPPPLPSPCRSQPSSPVTCQQAPTPCQQAPPPCQQAPPPCQQAPPPCQQALPPCQQALPPCQQTPVCPCKPCKPRQPCQQQRQPRMHIEIQQPQVTYQHQSRQCVNSSPRRFYSQSPGRYHTASGQQYQYVHATPRAMTVSPVRYMTRHTPVASPTRYNTTQYGQYF